MPFTLILRADGTVLRRCRACNCTDESPCLKGGEPCFWVSDDQCSACFQVKSIQQGEEAFLLPWLELVGLEELAAYQASFWAGAATVFELCKEGDEAALARVGEELRERAERCAPSEIVQ